jgi:hypothetical protein
MFFFNRALARIGVGRLIVICLQPRVHSAWVALSGCLSTDVRARAASRCPWRVILGLAAYNQQATEGGFEVAIASSGEQAVELRMPSTAQRVPMGFAPPRHPWRELDQPPTCLSFGQLMRKCAMKKLILFAAVGLSLTASASVTSAEEARVGVGVGPVGAGVTVGQSPSPERRTTVIKEREPRDETVVIRKERREPRDKVIIRERE